MNQRILPTILAAGLALTSLVSAADVTVFYPNEDKPVFTVTAPDDWEFAAGSEDNPYCTLTKGETVLYFKTVEGTEEKFGEAIEETYEYVKETYPGVELPQPNETKIDGKEALAASGSGKDKDGVLTNFGFAWVLASPSEIAELWYESSDTDQKVAAEAIAILSSFKAK